MISTRLCFFGRAFVSFVLKLLEHDARPPMGGASRTFKRRELINQFAIMTSHLILLLSNVAYLLGKPAVTGT